MGSLAEDATPVAVSSTPVGRSIALPSAGTAAGPADRPHLATGAAAAEEPVAAVRLEARHGNAGRHLDLLQDLAGAGIDAPHVARLVFPGGVPELAVDPGHAGDEAVGFDGAQDRSGLRIDLIDFAGAVVPDPQRAFGPGEPGA